MFLEAEIVNDLIDESRNPDEHDLQAQVNAAFRKTEEVDSGELINALKTALTLLYNATGIDIQIPGDLNLSSDEAIAELRRRLLVPDHYKKA
jgi:hypothetical protein